MSHSDSSSPHDETLRTGQQRAPFLSRELLEAGQNSRQRFPFQLHDMLQDASIKGFEKVVCWHPGGNAFRVHDQEKFLKFILPRYFGATKYKSFQRQLNLYKFQGEGRYTAVYSHQNFVRDQRHLCSLVRRVSPPGTGVMSNSPGLLERVSGEQEQSNPSLTSQEIPRTKRGWSHSCEHAGANLSGIAPPATLESYSKLSFTVDAHVGSPHITSSSVPGSHNIDSLPLLSGHQQPPGTWVMCNSPGNSTFSHLELARVSGEQEQSNPSLLTSKEIPRTRRDWFCEHERYLLRYAFHLINEPMLEEVTGQDDVDAEIISTFPRLGRVTQHE